MAYNFKDLPDISTIQPERLIKYRVSEDKFSAEVLLPGLWYTDFDKKIGGKMSLWALAKLEESVRFTATQYGLMTKLRSLDGNNVSAFVVANNVQLSNYFHSITYDSYFGQHFPIYGLYQVCDVGKTSFSVSVELYDHRNKTFIASTQVKLVHIDFKTRRPKLISEEFSGEMERFLAKGNSVRRPLLKTTLPEMPVDAYVHTVKSLYSDCDANYHVNQSIYSRWASDAASAASVSGKLPSFGRHIELYPLQEMKRTFYGEVLVNKEVTIYVWESAEVTKLVNVLMKQNNTLIALIQMTFFEGDPIVVTPSLKSVL